MNAQPAGALKEFPDMEEKRPDKPRYFSANPRPGFALCTDPACRMTPQPHYHEAFHVMISPQTAVELREHDIPTEGLEIVDPAKTKADYLVVMRWSDPPILPDNVRSTCSVCGHATQERPHAPKAKRICAICVVEFNQTRH